MKSSNEYVNIFAVAAAAAPDDYRDDNDDEEEEDDDKNCDYETENHKKSDAILNCNNTLP